MEFNWKRKSRHTASSALSLVLMQYKQYNLLHVRATLRHAMNRLLNTVLKILSINFRHFARDVTATIATGKAKKLVSCVYFLIVHNYHILETQPTLCSVTLILLTWRIGRVPNNASKWQMGFNSAFKGLIFHELSLERWDKVWFQFSTTMPK
jgi:hypothetical protein